MRDSYTGSAILSEHREMIADRWAAQWSLVLTYGRGNRAAKRARAIAARRAECRWCGTLTGGAEFCDASCRASYFH